MKRGQASFEYILIIGVAMMFIIPGTLLFFNYSQKSNDELSRASIVQIGNEIIDSVDKVYYVGESSWETVKVNIPDKVVGMEIINMPNNYELVIKYDSWGGISEAVFFSNVNITGAYFSGGRFQISDFPHTGLNVIKIMSKGDYVLLNETR